jgi:hypothetical protein
MQAFLEASSVTFSGGLNPFMHIRIVTVHLHRFVETTEHQQTKPLIAEEK